VLCKAFFHNLWVVFVSVFDGGRIVAVQFSFFRCCIGCFPITSTYQPHSPRWADSRSFLRWG
jgi:hypothetical protein